MFERAHESWKVAAPGIALAVVGACLAVLGPGDSRPRPWIALAVLAAGGAAASALASRVPGPRVLRLAPAFVLAALVAFPVPGGGILVAAAALLAGRRGFVGPATSNGPSGSVVFVTMLVVQATATLVPRSGDHRSLATAIHIGVLYLLLQGIAWSGGWLRSTRSQEVVHRAFGHAMTREAVAIPLAWILVLVTVRPGMPPGALPVVAGLAVLAAWATASIESADARLRSVNDALAARVTELATLNATGREIVSSLDLRRVITIADRECRKILDVDEFSIALTDPETSLLRTVYRRRRGASPDETDGVVQPGLETSAAAERTPVRVDDLSSRLASPPSTFRDITGSALVVPLLVENRVVGVLGVRCDRIAAYDDHRLSFLTTIAQQAAIAIENARHYRMATRDSLTGLFLRDYFFRRVDEEFHRSQRYRVPFALLMVDLDRFKSINDAHGHPAGDRYLSAVGRSIREHLRAADLACRYGGDEFCVLLPQTDREGGIAIAERLRRGIAAIALELNEVAPFRATASVGIASYPDDCDGDLTSLLRNADQALYRAKRGGRDRVSAWSSSSAPRAQVPSQAASRPLHDVSGR